MLVWDTAPTDTPHYDLDVIGHVIEPSVRNPTRILANEFSLPS